jgi:alanine dehydrogenase
MQRMAALQINAYSYEYFEDELGKFPMMSADGWLSGRLAVMNAAFYLQTHHGGRGVVLGGMDAKPHCNVVVIGYGNVGNSAIQTALSLGAHVTVVGRSEESLSTYARNNPDTHCVLVDDPAFETALFAADIVIGAILISTYDTPALLTESLVSKMKPGAIIVDVTCGYGKGYMPTADKITMPGVGPYARHGVLHLKNPRLPAMTPVSAAHNASRLYAPHLLALGEMIFDETKVHEPSQNGQILKEGEIVHHHVLSDFERIESDQYENYELVDHLVAP